MQTNTNIETIRRPRRTAPNGFTATATALAAAYTKVAKVARAAAARARQDERTEARLVKAGERALCPRRPFEPIGWDEGDI